MLGKMIALAATGHKDQYDKSGKPYILHPLKVMELLNTKDEELMCIAVGHDLIEDCGHLLIDAGYPEISYINWADYLSNLGFSNRVIRGIGSLTKEPNETYEHYKQGVKLNRDAIVVKMADLTHNSDVTRLKGITDKDLARIKRYHEFYYELLVAIK